MTPPRLFSQERRRHYRPVHPFTTWRSRLAGLRRVSAPLRRSAVYRVWSRCVSTSPMTHPVARWSMQSSERMGRIDGLVNNAGGSVLGAAIGDLDRGRRAADLNVLWVLRMSRPCASRLMRSRQGSGRIVNISSVVGFLPAPFMAIYAASKHAVEGLLSSRWITPRCVSSGIRVARSPRPGHRTKHRCGSAPGDHPPSDYHGEGTVSTTIASQIAGAPRIHGVARTIERALDARRFARIPVGGEARSLSTCAKGCLPLCFGIVPYAAPTTSTGDRPAAKSWGGQSDEHPYISVSPHLSGLLSRRIGGELWSSAFRNIRMPEIVVVRDLAGEPPPHVDG